MTAGTEGRPPGTIDTEEVTSEVATPSPTRPPLGGTRGAARTTYLLEMSKTRDQLHEELLVLKSQQGDARTFEEPVDRFHPRLWRHAYQLLGEEEPAREVLQEGWLAIIKSLPSLKEAAAFPSWAYRIITHKAADWLRKRKRYELVFTEITDEVEPQFNPPPPEADTMLAAVHTLPPSSRAVLSLRYADDLSISEIAIILGLPEGTVKSRLHRLRVRLRQLLKVQSDD
ncbi:MAG: RNA polymerase sigma factor [Armatimonadota bacterium]|nr:MAG: RNA polymerase sigma factor [Armatimonadota bacterium]